MMTYNETHRRVFPLVPTACTFNKQDDYFWTMRKAQIEVSQAQGDFGDRLGVRKVTKAKARGCKGKWKTQIDYFGNGNTIQILLREW